MQGQISRTNPVPLYWQLAEIVKSQISMGVLHPGDKLPTEEWFTKNYNVSRVTVRRAMQLLLDNGVLTRKRGESPSIAYPRLNRQTNRLTGLSEDLIAMGHIPGSVTLCCETTTAPIDIAAQLNIQMGDPVFHLRRLRFADEIPLAIHDCYYPMSICDGILSPAFHDKSIYRYLELNGISLEHATQTVSACNASKEVAKLLSVSAGSALLHVERTSYSADNAAVEFSDMLYNPARYDLRIELNR